MKRHLLLLLAVIPALGWMSSCSYGPDPGEASSSVTITETRTSIHYAPTNGNDRDTWLLWYPGGLVDPHVYGDWAGKLAEGGLHVVVVKMPVNLAVTAINRGIRLMEEFPEARQWVIGGHSLGGAMACSAVDGHRDAFQGMVLMAAYPGEQVDLSDWGGGVLSLSAENDGLARPEDLQARRNLLPAGYDSGGIFDWPAGLGGTTVYYQIPGGNHGQFGSYAPQKGDNPATITREAQHQELVNWILTWFNLNGWQ